MTATAGDRDFIVNVGKEILSVPPGADRRDFVVRPLQRTWSEVCLGRQIFGFGMDTSYVVQRGRVSLGLD